MDHGAAPGTLRLVVVEAARTHAGNASITTVAFNAVKCLRHSYDDQFIAAQHAELSDDWLCVHTTWRAYAEQQWADFVQRVAILVPCRGNLIADARDQVLSGTVVSLAGGTFQAGTGACVRKLKHVATDTASAEQSINTGDPAISRISGYDGRPTVRTQQPAHATGD